MESDYNKLEYIGLLEKANASLIDTIEESIFQYYQSKPVNFDELPNYQTPRPWENKVIKILNKYQSEIQESIKKYTNGEHEPLSVTTNILGGLSKNLDNFDTCWMTTTSEEKYLKDLDCLIEVADNIESAI